jgi:tetratricopeptide (TPR) repeat protein
LENNDQEAIFDMDMRRAAQYIHSNEPSRAEIILRPYVKPGANKFILSDYMMALRACNQPNKVLEIYNTCVTDKENFPAYGTQVVGDVLLRQGKFKDAAEIYSKILAKEKVENVPFVQLGYSYCLAKLNRKEESVAAYKKVADLNVERYNNIICMDCDALLAAGRINTARKIMSLLAENNEKYQLRYAKGLVNVGADYEEKSSNFCRDEILLGRDYKHEAEKILRKLEPRD